MIHRSTSTKGIELIKSLEGFSSRIYLCQGGYKTIGYGHKLADRKKPPNTEISKQEADFLLKRDLFKVEQAILNMVSIPLSDNQFDALVSFIFNVGAGAFQRSTLRQKLNYKSYDEAAQEFLRWVYVGGKKSYGLIRRRKIERALFEL